MKYEYISLSLAVLGENCYTVDCGGGSAAVIDPGGEAERILGAASCRGLKIAAVMLTHGHFDHVGAARAVSEASGGCPVYLNSGDLDLPPRLSRGLCGTTDYSEGDVITVGEVKFKVMQTPGHSRGAVCLVCGGLLFTGDTLFCGSCGRTDLFGGSTRRMRESLDRLCALEGDFTVLPGHGPATTLERERRENPYMINARRERRSF